MRLEFDFHGIAIYARAVICILPIVEAKHNKHSCAEQTPRIKINQAPHMHIINASIKEKET
jgi:hypothetical protein